ncbi:RNA 3'-terminal phosphate cyclase [Halapricum hydrolyticum]|uniref:RNA 3'-terminal phosphate cyclase n=1 Tax=Halapricum hydrolyticum TaxID=2979991 RepID=A0AAE3IBN1_9EURY|nr:RNA 3'-terminal phosphate cyclase [Halapricum hydrolyticum]MCU4718681.1 RNA 3'-terminal phosphate cyclase [Halapricum hydrolyticum]MCU4727633.1 RNA 3'-terminal phosphate cyclase [Halapricum hydrolyticum]
MLTIDGSDGGGQLLRTSLSLAVITDTSVRVESIRGSRPEPGLKPQHLAAVELLAEYCDADLEGASLGSEALVFEPGETRRHALSVEIETAGSVTLLLDAVLPLATVIDDPLTVTATGGTDVKWSPPVAYLRHVKLPLLARFGLDAELEVGRIGFYPKGGGEVTLRLSPSSLSPIELDARGSLRAVDVYSTASADLEDSDVADRQADRVFERLDAAALPPGERTVRYVETGSTGSSLVIRARYDRTLAGFDALGEPGRPSETVADLALEDFERFRETDAAVDRHMADQLLVFLALAGGRVGCPAVTDHVRTHRSLLSEFGYDVTLESEDGTAVLSSPVDSAE